MSLSREPARKLTDRECAKIICGTIGTLLQMANPVDVERAIQFIGDNRKAIMDTGAVYNRLADS